LALPVLMRSANVARLRLVLRTQAERKATPMCWIMDDDKFIQLSGREWALINESSCGGRRIETRSAEAMDAINRPLRRLPLQGETMGAG
jgi:hypothetical protein